MVEAEGDVAAEMRSIRAGSLARASRREAPLAVRSAVGVRVAVDEAWVAHVGVRSHFTFFQECFAIEVRRTREGTTLRELDES